MVEPSSHQYLQRLAALGGLDADEIAQLTHAAETLEQGAAKGVSRAWAPDAGPGEGRHRRTPAQELELAENDRRHAALARELLALNARVVAQRAPAQATEQPR